jgi:hypothetical protein
MLFPEHGEDSGFDVIESFSMLHPEVRLRSSLSSIHGAVKAAPLNHDSTTVLGEAAWGSLKPPPTRRFRRADLSMTLTRLLDTITSRLSTG